MKTIFRKDIIQKIRPFYDDEQIKIITGMRRTGKSILLRQIISEIEQTIDLEHIIYCNFESLEFLEYNDIKDLNAYILSKINDAQKYYLFFDEIQNIDNFEILINSLRSTQNVSIFITGSNGKLLSTEISTVLSGRYVKFTVTPFSFKEAIEYKQINKAEYNSFFKNYLEWGGLPHRFDFQDDMSMSSYLSDVYDSIAQRDIVQRAGIRNIPLYNSLLHYVLENVGNLFSATKVINYLKSIRRSAGTDTIYDYLFASESALIINKVERYNIIGKETFSNISKYYATDLGIMQIKANKNKLNLGSLLENIVYNELKRRGYEVYVGELPNAEIDFVAIKNGVTEYYQVSYLLSDENTINREFSAFDKIKDNYDKFVISTDSFDMSKNGIKHYNIVEWLLNT